MKPAPEQFLHGDRGARIVVLPQAVCSWLYQAARIPELKDRHKGYDPLVDAVLVAISLAALEKPSGVGSRSAPGSEVVALSGQRRTTTTRALADQLNITTRAVSGACNDGRLDATRDHLGNWRIDAQSAARFIAERKEAS